MRGLGEVRKKLLIQAAACNAILPRDSRQLSKAESRSSSVMLGALASEPLGDPSYNLSRVAQPALTDGYRTAKPDAGRGTPGGD